MTIRPATLADIPAISELIDEHVRREEVLPRTPKAIRETLNDWIVGERDNEILAIGSLLHYSPQLAEVRSLAVHDRAKGNGLGRAVVEALIAKARSYNISTLFALTLVEPFFTKMGFEPCSKSAFPEKIWRDCQLCPNQDA
ncbi:MAG: GNAT family N-acetyltransferase, partial [Anaerolineales bacterium]|nr:GNAT family N-acetyltransferase [Anaerolineales bacterium]